MTPRLLDTNILSELRRTSPSHGVLHFIANTPVASLFVSTVTLAEIRYGVQRIPDPDRRTELEHWLSRTIRPMFTGRVLPVTEDIFVRWRALVERGRKSGRTYAQPDLFLAATALEHGLTLVTRNTSDFADIGVTLINPWQISSED